MIDFEIYRGIGNSVSYRSNLVTELARNLAAQDQRDMRLRERLLELAPESLREWLNEDLILAHLFQYGRSHAKIYFNGDYGFGDLGDVEAKMKALQKAWKDVVLIKRDEPDLNRIEVRLTAVM